MSRIIAILAVFAAVYVIYDVWTDNKRLNETQKLIWTIAALFFSIVTAAAYYYSFKRNNLN
jgi:hypothetical protein